MRQDWTGWVEPEPVQVCQVCGEHRSFHRIDLKKVVSEKDGHAFVLGGNLWVGHAQVLLPPGEVPDPPWKERP